MFNTHKNILKLFFFRELYILLIIFFISFLITFSIVNGFLYIPFFIGLILMGFIVVVFALKNPFYAFLFNLIVAFFSYLPSRILNVDLHLANLSEVLTYIIFAIVFFKVDITKKFELARSPVSIVYIIYGLFMILQAFNPDMDNIFGWFFFIRRFLMFVLIYVLSYRLLDCEMRIKIFLKVLIFLVFLVALYACYQQAFGLLPFEMRFLQQNEHDYRLWFQGGQIRKFSFLSDPVQVGILCGAAFLFTFSLLLSKVINNKNLWIVIIITITLLLGVFYTGTRTANIMILAGIAFYVILTLIKKSTMFVVLNMGIAMIFVFYVPIYNPTLQRIRSTFDMKDASLSVRDENRHYIQPYIYKHPIGGGIATSGLRGTQYNPEHELAGFPPDSGFVQAAIETGWIGFFLTIVFLSTILLQGVNYYFRAHEDKNKAILIAITVSLFAMIFASYAQVAIGQIPGVYYFYPLIALMKRVMELDQGKI